MQVTEAKRTEKPGEHRVLDTEGEQFSQKWSNEVKSRWLVTLVVGVLWAKVCGVHIRVGCLVSRR